MVKCSTALVCVSSLLGPFVLLFYSLSFATDYWISYKVDRSRLTTEQRSTSQTNEDLRFYHSRNRGLFRECLQGNETKFLDTSKKVVDGKCYHVLYEPRLPSINYSTQFWARLHLQRCHLAFMIIGLVTYMIAFIVGMIVACKRNPGFLKAAGLFGFTSAFSTAAAIAFFHGAEYIERTTITDDTDGVEYYQNWPLILQQVSERRYDWSYILGWCGMIVAAICSVCYIIAAWMVKSERRLEDSDEILKHRYAGGPMLIQDPAYMDDPYYNKVFYQQARPTVGHPANGHPNHGHPYVVEMANRPGYGEPHWQWQ